MPAGVFHKGDGMGGHRNGKAVWKEGSRTYDSLRLKANPSSMKRRAPRVDLSKLTADEQERWKKARDRRYSASARQRQMDREQDLRDQVKILSIVV